MRKFLLSGALALTCLCSSSFGKPFRIVTLQHPLQLAVLMITDGVPDVEVTCVAHQGADCCEKVNFVPADLKTIGAANVVVASRLDLEPDLLRLLGPDMKVIDSTVFIEGYEYSPNTHVSLNPSLFSKEMEAVAVQLSDAEPLHAEAYRHNVASNLQRLAELSYDMKQAFAQIPNRRIATYHDAFSDFADEFGFKVVTVVQGGDEAPTPARLAIAIETMKKEKVSVLLVQTGGSGERTAEMVAREVGATVCHFDIMTDGPATKDAYVETMTKNMNAILEAFHVSPDSTSSH